jgi:hypothetical protein
METELTKNNVNRALIHAGVQIPLGLFVFLAFTAGSIVQWSAAFLSSGDGWIGLGLFLAGLAGGGGLIARGAKGVMRYYRYRKLRNLLDAAQPTRLDYLEQKLGRERKKLLKDMKWMQKRGFFPEHVRLDAERFLPYPEPEPVSISTGDADVDEALTAGLDSMRRLIELDRLIVSQEMEPPVQKLIAVSRDIFDLISKDKRKLRQTRQFMNYYLPTALKLLTDYADFEQQEVKGENALESMRKIEGVMDTLVTAFQRELDALYLDKAIDISADIEVMKAMIQTDAGGKNHG